MAGWSCPIKSAAARLRRRIGCPFGPRDPTRLEFRLMTRFAPFRTPLAAAVLTLLAGSFASHAAVPTDTTAATAVVPPALPAGPVALAPFVATYQAYNGGSLAGNAVMRLVKRGGDLWRVDMDVKADSGLAGLAGV